MKEGKVMASQEFLNGLPNDPVEAFEKVHERVEYLVKEIPETGKFDTGIHNELIEMAALARVLVSSMDFPVNLPSFELISDPRRNANSIRSYLSNLRSNIDSNQATHTYKKSIAMFEIERGLTNYYEFEQNDKNKIQQLINEIRNTLSNTTIFQEEHKQRILNRL